MTSKWSTNENGTTGKICGQCKLWKSLNRYNISNYISNLDGLKCSCKLCESKRNKVYHIINKINIAKRKTKYNKQEKVKIRLAKDNANRRGLGFNLKYKIIIIEPYSFHHLNNNDVVAIPTDLHLLYFNEGFNLIQHRFMIKQIAKQLYKE